MPFPTLRALDWRLARQLGYAALLAGVLIGAGPAHAVALVLDDFSSPEPAVTGTPTGTGAQFFERTFGTFAGVSSQVREVNYNLFSDPLSSGVDTRLGSGSAGIDAGAGAHGEYLFRYGAFTRPDDPNIGGPLMGLDLTAFNTFRAEFSAVEQGTLNLNVVLYTSAPYMLPDNTPLYYLQSGINFGPDTAGGPMVADLFLNHLNPHAAPYAPYFNFSQVDGIVFLIDRSGGSEGNAYTLDTLLFAQAVPEPAEYMLMLAGLALLAGVARRRSVSVRKQAR